MRVQLVERLSDRLSVLDRCKRCEGRYQRGLHALRQVNAKTDMREDFAREFVVGWII